MTCDAQHPEQPDVRCQDPGGPGTHSPHYAAPDWDWQDDDSRAWQERAERTARRSPTEWQGELTGMAQRIRRSEQEANRPPIVRTDDPWAAHVGAERIEPHRDTEAGIALAMFRERSRRNRWEFMDVNGPIGKVDGDRRARSLRDLERGAFYIKMVPTLTGPNPHDYLRATCPVCGFELFFMSEQKRPGARPLEWSRCIPCEVTYTSEAGTLTLTPI